MKLIKGKFYNEAGESVPLEFGNKEQIGLIELAKEFKNGRPLWFKIVDEDMVWGFRCPCRTEVIVPDGENDMPKSIECSGCGTEYHLTENDDEVIVKTK